jgi:hypothetical protein
LNGISFASTTLTIQSCQSACAAAGYKYAGVEYSVRSIYIRNDEAEDLLGDG